MALKVVATNDQAIQNTETVLVPVGTAQQVRRAIITLHNSDSATRKYTIHEYASGQAAAQANAVHGWQVNLIAKEYFNLDTYILGARTITAFADNSDVVLAKVTILELT